MTRSTDDRVDLREVGAALRHGAWIIAAGAVAGLAVAGAFTAAANPSYDARATVLLRPQGPAAPMLAVGGGSGDEGGGVSLGGIAGLLGGGSGFETEVELLTSRAVVGEVVDSLGLQARVVEPRAAAPADLFRALEVPRDVAPDVFAFRKEGDGWRFEGESASGTARPGVPFRLGGARAELRGGALPDRFTVEIADRDGAIDAVLKRLRARKAGGEVAELRFTAYDPRTAAAVPNALLARYLERRKTTDRGVNQRRYEFLSRQADSVASALVAAEGMLRRSQEASGVLDPRVTGESEVELASELRAELQTVVAETGALQRILEGRLTTREMAAFPTLLRNGAVNNILNRLLEVETQRTQLLERRTEEDPEVQAMDRTVRQLEGELSALSRSYLRGLTEQERAMRENLARYQTTLMSLPATAEAQGRLQREVRRLSETLVALQTQLVTTQLAAIAEGGDVRPVDAAVVPRAPTFPKPLFNLAGGLLGGLFFGAAGAVVAGRMRRRVREPWEAELAAGAPAALLTPHGPLLVGRLDRGPVVLVLPVGREAPAGAVAARLAATAALQGRSAAVVDLGHAPAAALPAPASEPSGGTGVALLPSEAGEAAGVPVFRANGNGAAGVSVREALGELEPRFAPVVVALRGLDDPATAALFGEPRPVVLAARGGRVTDAELRAAVEVLARLGMPLAGVVLEPAPRRAAARA